MRWKHPTLGMLDAAVFLGLAERSDLIIGIGAAVLTQACSVVAAWQDPVFESSVAVNVSAGELASPGFTGRVRETLRATGVDPSCLRLEVTEYALLRSGGRAAATMAELGELGVRWTLDEVCGVRSLGLAVRYPIGAVKLGRGLVGGLGDHAGAARAGETVFAARVLGLEVVAAGVETHAQLQHLRVLGCDHAQGHLLGRPIDRLAERVAAEVVTTGHPVKAGPSSLARPPALGHGGWMTQTTVMSDRELKSAVVDELEWTPSVDSTHIGVTVSGGAVTLFGEVDSYPEKRLAEEAAERVRGVSAIAEDITVRTSWAGVNDTDLARESAAALRRSVDVPDSVQVAVRDGVLTLSGVVAWHFERRAADRAVRHVRGVAEIDNEITLRPGEVAADLKSTIEAALQRNGDLDGAYVSVAAATDGSVTLSGVVSSWSDRRGADEVAWSAPGVNRVKNHLTIGF